MKLLTKEILETLPVAYDPEAPLRDLMIHVKFFTPDGGWTWYVASGEMYEDDPRDFLFFGYVVGVVPEWGSFLLSELESVRGALGLPVERDLQFRPGKALAVIPELF